MNKLIFRYILIIITLSINLVFAKEITKQVIPAYKLPLGKKLIYNAQSDFSGINFSSGARTQTQFWVWSKNPDSSFRIIVNQHIASYRMLDDSARKDDAPQTKWVYFDLFPDGKFIDNVSLNNFDPSLYFIPLPADTETARLGWSRYDSVNQERTQYKMTNPLLPAMVWNIQINKETPFDSVYLLSSSSLAELDFKQGLVTRKKNEASRGYGYASGKTTSLVALDSVRLFDTLGFTSFARELISFFQAESAYNQILEKVEFNLPEVRSVMANAKTVLDQALASTKDSIVRSMLNDDLSGHEQLITRFAEDSLWYAQNLNKKAADWKINGLDLSGNIHTLKQYRGKVVILDFWYRGCPWCIRAMPSLNQVAQDFQDSSVVVLGMNIDKKLDDALFVQDKMKLVYPSLQCGDTYKKYNVSGFPTLFVIDQKGIIRDIHIGYSPDLGEKVKNKIRSLLESK